MKKIDINIFTPINLIEMEFPNSLNTGFDNSELNCLEKKELEINVASSVLAFTEYAMLNAVTYTKHCKRTETNVDDIKKALKLEVYNYFKHPNLVQNVKKWRNIVLKDDERDDLENLEDHIVLEDQSISKSVDVELNNSNTCSCNVCIQMREVEHLWSNYIPQDELGKIMKKHIDGIKN